MWLIHLEMRKSTIIYERNLCFTTMIFDLFFQNAVNSIAENNELSGQILPIRSGYIVFDVIPRKLCVDYGINICGDRTFLMECLLVCTVRYLVYNAPLEYADLIFKWEYRGLSGIYK